MKGYRALLVAAALLCMALLCADGSSGTPVKEVYTCYGDEILLQYDGEATQIHWKVTDEDGNVLAEEDGTYLLFEADQHPELSLAYVTQTVTTDQGSSDEMIHLNLMHLNSGQFTVSFYDGSGGNLLDQDVFDASRVCRGGVYSTFPDSPTRADHSFDGWYFDDGTGEAKFLSSTVIDRDIDVYAKWKDIYSVIFKSGGDVVEMARVVDGGSVPLPPLESSRERLFAGWYTDEGCVHEYDASGVVGGNMVLYAKWVDVSHGSGEKDSLGLPIMIPLLVLTLILVAFRLHKGRVKKNREFRRYGQPR